MPHRYTPAVIFILAVLMLPFSLQASVDNAAIKRTEGYIEVEEGRLYYQSFGQGPLMIVLHGGPGLDQTYLLPQMLALAKNRQVVFYDQRGSGKSFTLGSLSGSRINMPQFVNDLETVRKYFKQEKYMLVGHSFGALLAMEYAISHQNHISSLILLNPMPATSVGLQAFLTDLNKRILPLKEKLDAILTSKAFLGGNPTSSVNYYRTLFSVYFYDPLKVSDLSLNFTLGSILNSFKITQTFMENYFNKLDLIPALKKLKLPTLIIAGDADVIPISTTKEIAEAIPNSRLKIIKNCGQFPYIEKPDDFFKIMN